MIGIAVATKWEWETVLQYFGKTHEYCDRYPFGEYFQQEQYGKMLLFYSTNTRKMNASAATQYMICRNDLTGVIVAGTCAGIDERYHNLDIVIPNLAVQYDCTVKEIEPLIKKSFSVEMDLSALDFEHNTGTIGTADKAVVMWKDYLELQENGITVADTESACAAYICRQNGVKCFIVKGISDFPKNGDDAKVQNAEQINVYLENTPKVMNIILSEYLPKIVESF